MRKLIPLSLALLLIATQGAFGARWTELFNGKDLTGWAEKGGHAKYFVEDGCLVGEVIPGNKTNAFLCTTKNYSNFIMELDFKDDPMLNSGVQIRSEWDDHPTSVEWKGKTINIPAGYVHGYQVEIDADNVKKRWWSGGIYDDRRRLWLYPGQLGGDQKEFTKQGGMIFKDGDRNHLRIEAVGDSIKAYLNGVLCAHIHDSMTPTGFIGLQVHHVSDTSQTRPQIRFKNIRLMEVTPKAEKPEPEPNTLTDQEKKDGWRLLWDGKTTDGWRSAKAEDFPEKSWMIKDGELNVVASGNAEAQEGGDIITRERYSSFELVADFKTTPGCNSGIKYFVQPDQHPVTSTGERAAVGSAIGYEYQILDDERHPDAKLGRNGDRRLGSLYDLLPCNEKKKKVAPIGEWNTARILVRGNHVQHWLNGEKILDYNRASKEFHDAYAQSKFKNIPGYCEWTDGHILLQEHGSKVSFRNVKIRVIAAK